MLKFALQYETVAHFLREFPEKIATSGVYVKTDKPAEVGDPIALLFRFKSDPNSSFMGTGELVWIDQEEEARSGKKGLVVRNITLDPESQKAFGAHMRAQAKVAESPDEQPVHMVMSSSPPPPLPPPPAPVMHAPQPVSHAPVHHAPAPVTAHAAQPKKKWPIYVGVAAAVLVAGFAVWYFALGGKELVANFGIEYRDGKVTKVDPVSNSFSMGLIDQVSSDWVVLADTETQWVGVRGIQELREGDRIGLRYKASDNRYLAKQVTVKERVMVGTIGSLVDRTKGIFNLQDSKISGSIVELSSEFNDQVRNLVSHLKPGDAVESVYAIGADGKNAVRKLIVRERISEGVVSTVDAAAQSLSLKLDDDTSIALAASGSVDFKGLAGWEGLGEQDRVRVGYQPDNKLLRSVELVEKYVAPVVAARKPKLAPRVMRDVIYSTDDVVARFAFVFNRRPAHDPAQVFPGAFSRVMVRVPASSSAYPKSELFLSAGPMRTVRFTEDRGDMTITFLADKGVTPRCTFEVQSDRLVALCFKN